jgi:hypothetical protein
MHIKDQKRAIPGTASARGRIGHTPTVSHCHSVTLA